jgi:hypothetical protein
VENPFRNPVFGDQSIHGGYQTPGECLHIENHEEGDLHRLNFAKHSLTNWLEMMGRFCCQKGMVVLPIPGWSTKD